MCPKPNFGLSKCLPEAVSAGGPTVLGKQASATRTSSKKSDGQAKPDLFIQPLWDLQMLKETRRFVAFHRPWKD